MEVNAYEKKLLRNNMNAALMTKTRIAKCSIWKVMLDSDQENIIGDK